MEEKANISSGQFYHDIVMVSQVRKQKYNGMEIDIILTQSSHLFGYAYARQFVCVAPGETFVVIVFCDEIHICIFVARLVWFMDAVRI